MIEILEVRAKSNRELIGNIDTAKSIIWKSVYYGVGEFEIYVPATSNLIDILKDGNYITRYDDKYECGIIEHIEIAENSQDGRMIVASGRMVKSILDRRIIVNRTLVGSGLNYYWQCQPTILSGKVEEAVRKVVSENAIDPLTYNGSENRKISELVLGNLKGYTETIVTKDSESAESSADKQVTYQNLLKYSDSVLEEYELGAMVSLDRSALKFIYNIYKGEDRTRDSTTNNPVIFSQEFDNLKSFHYTIDSQSSKTSALIGGEGEGIERKCAVVYDWISGIDRREVFIDASSITQEEGSSDEEYRKQLETQGYQNIAQMKKVETFDGELDLTNSNLVYREDYYLGDKITIEDKALNIYINARILAVMEVEDDDGYNIEIEYGE